MIAPDREATAAEDKQVRVRSRASLRELEADLHGLRAEYGRVAADLLAGREEESVVEEVEREIDAVERDLRRARAAAEYLAE